MRYARIAIHELKEGTVEVSVGRAESALLPILRAQPGFVSYAVYRVDQMSVASVSVWESREAAQAAVQLTQDWIDGNLPETVLKSHVVVGEQVFESAGPLLIPLEEMGSLH
jgi:heme-degrading monooxygenase HmoA